jgi:hypothetical protein
MEMFSYEQRVVQGNSVVFAQNSDSFLRQIENPKKSLALFAAFPAG